MSAGKPVLWQIAISHYSEKVRWALAFKGVEHDRRTPPPGSHMPIALWLTRGAQVTFPVLALDGERIGDSTAIIAALEQRYPEPPLYPDEPAECRRALELEERLDEELGPAVRLFAWHEAIADRDRVAEIAGAALPGAIRDVAPARAAAASFASTFAGLRFGVKSEEAAEEARRTILAFFDELDEQLADREYLVGERFSVADLTAAALLYPLVLPPEGPQLPEPTESFERFRRPLAERLTFEWAEEMFARHRKPEVSAAAR